MEKWKERTKLLVGEENLDLFSKIHILIVGIGGVGAYAAEMLVRAGIGEITIADSDNISETNLNRQLLALSSTIGKSKVKVMEERLMDINPKVIIHPVDKYIKDELTYSLLDSSKYDYVVDAIDTLSPKANLIKAAMDRNIPVVSAMGAGAKLNPTQIEISDISKTHHCPLAHMLRKRLHKMGIREGFIAVFSAEEPIEGALTIIEEGENKKAIVGTISYMPAAFGCAVASVVIKNILSAVPINNQ